MGMGVHCFPVRLPRPISPLVSSDIDFGGLPVMWLTEIAVKHPISCNFTKNGIVRPIRGLVLHIQEGTEKGTYSWFNSKEAKASSHFGNPKIGKLEQFVDTDDMAWTQKDGNPYWLSVE